MIKDDNKSKADSTNDAISDIELDNKAAAAFVPSKSILINKLTIFNYCI